MSVWTRLHDIYKRQQYYHEYAGKPVLTQNKHIIIPIGEHSTQIRTIIKYDRAKDISTDLKLLTQGRLSGDSTDTLCIDNNIIYIPCIDSKTIVKIDLNTKEKQFVDISCVSV